MICSFGTTWKVINVTSSNIQARDVVYHVARMLSWNKDYLYASIWINQTYLNISKSMIFNNTKRGRYHTNTKSLLHTIHDHSVPFVTHTYTTHLLTHTADGSGFLDELYAGGTTVRCWEEQFGRWTFETVMDLFLLSRREGVEYHNKMYWTMSYHKISHSISTCFQKN